MDLLYYNDFDVNLFSVKYSRVLDFLTSKNFSGLNIKKIPEHNLYRIKLDDANRLLVKFVRYNTNLYVLLLEYIENHNYHKSRFLNGKKIDENCLEHFNFPVEKNERNLETLIYINQNKPHFYLLDKIISFDEEQHEIFNKKPPLIIIGSAGSGKTVLTLEKIKTLNGKILYVTLSPYLIQSSLNLYFSNNYENENQDVEFLSFREFLETMHIIEGKEIDFRIFEQWFLQHRNYTKIRDTHKLFEEFGGVIMGASIDKEYLDKDEYLSLGIKRSVFSGQERAEAYSIFEKYLNFINEKKYYDLNIVSHRWLTYCTPCYDFVVIDEVQDITNIQLFLILQSLKKSSNFILCGDSNQIVHPNFFSWTNVKTLFYENLPQVGEIINILRTNYRNSLQITTIANTLLNIKNLRFGSIDKESTFLNKVCSDSKGEVTLFPKEKKYIDEINQRTKDNVSFAVIVMRNEDKDEARKWFHSPLLFSIHEVKGLEYENVILFNFISEYENEFCYISEGISIDDIKLTEFNYSRAKDKSDRTMDVYKFYINSLYVAISRATKKLFIIETNPRHPILCLMGLSKIEQEIRIQTQSSSQEEWQKEAQRLEMQGKKEQAKEIRQKLMGQNKQIQWEPLNKETIEVLKKEALNPDNFNKKAKDKLFDYALLYHIKDIFNQLERLLYHKAVRYREEYSSVFRKHYTNYQLDNFKTVYKEIQKYGVDYRDIFNLTPLMVAVMCGAVKTVKMLIDNGADKLLTDNYEKNILQIAFYRSYFSKLYPISKLKEIYPLIVTNNIKIKIDEHLVKIDNHQIDYFILNLFIAIQYFVIEQKSNFPLIPKAIQIDDFIHFLNEFPESILPEYRKQRSYLSAHLAKQEVNRPGSKKLYLRSQRGFYIINPDLEVLINNEWKNVNELTFTKDILSKLQEIKSIENKLIETLKMEKLKKRENSLKKMNLLQDKELSEINKKQQMDLFEK